MASPAESKLRHLQASPFEQPTIADVLEEIFLRLPTAADLARAATVCASFRRVIADHAFLRRFRALHPPPLLGILSIKFVPAQPPHPSAAAARAFAGPDAADFSCSFLPSRERWHRSDFRDGRALFSGVPEGSTYLRGGFWPVVLLRDFAVCDPLHRRYLLLPAIPDDLAALVHQPDIRHFNHFLAPAAENEVDASFRVMCLTQCTTKLVLFVFSSGAGKWDAVTFDGWINLMTGTGNLVSGTDLHLGTRHHYAHGNFYWEVYPANRLLVLDAHRMEFSALSLPRGPEVRMMAIVEAGLGGLGMFTLITEFDGERGAFVCHLLYQLLQNDGEGANKWQSKGIILLPLTYRYTIIGVAGGYLLLQGIPEDLHSIPLPERPEYEFFSLNLQTFQLERFCGFRHAIISAHLFAGFPPSLSPPTI